MLALLAAAALRVVLSSPADLGTVEVRDVPVELAFPASVHAHLVIDNEATLEAPAAGKYALKGLPPGPHLLRAVLCKPGHEVVKTAGAFALARFWVGLTARDEKERREAEDAVWPDARKPLLTYVLPLPDRKPSWPVLEGGTADATPSPAKLDFYLANATLSKSGSRVRVVVDKKELPTVREWKPVPLKLKQGAHRVTIDLLDRRGTKVKNVVNRSDRTVQN